MHRLKSHCSGTGLAAQAARRQPKNHCDFDKARSTRVPEHFTRLMKSGKTEQKKAGTRPAF